MCGSCANISSLAYSRHGSCLRWSTSASDGGPRRCAPAQTHPRWSLAGCPACQACTHHAVPTDSLFLDPGLEGGIDGVLCGVAGGLRLEERHARRRDGPTRVARVTRIVSRVRSRRGHCRHDWPVTPRALRALSDDRHRRRTRPRRCPSWRAQTSTEVSGTPVCVLPVLNAALQVCQTWLRRVRPRDVYRKC